MIPIGVYRRRCAWPAVLVLLVLALLGCTDRRWPIADQDVRIAVANDGAEPLRCTILFGHWVEQDAGTVAPGDVLDVPMRRQASDGALYVSRYDGRKMMVENLVCGPLEQWWERRSDIALLSVRAGTAQHFSAVCRITDRARCSALAPKP